MASFDPVALPVTDHLEVVRGSVLALARHARAAGLDVPVPTCPDWTVRRLVGHLGAAHRRTTALLRAAASGEVPMLDDLETDVWRKVAKTGRSSADPVDWLTSGAITLIGALARAGDDVVVPVLGSGDEPGDRPGDGPGSGEVAPRTAWARRMAHETTVHAVDALAAALGRPPTVAEARDGVPIRTAVAVDGLDELLRGFVARGPLRSGAPAIVLVRTTDVDAAWTVAIGPDHPPRVTGGRPDPSEPSGGEILTAEADAVSLYLGLWQRTPLAAPLWPLWRATAVD